MATLRAGSEPTNKEERAAWLAAKHAGTLLNDVAGKPIRHWDNQHRQMEFTYDALQRPTNTSLRLSASAVHEIAFASESQYPQAFQNLVKFR